MEKDKIIGKVIEIEGGYVNDPSDSGGETKFGITKVVARGFGYQGLMKDMPYQTAVDIYEARYWKPLQLDVVLKLAPTVAEELFDTGVNMGIERAGIFLQRCLNALSIGVDNLVVDGKIGQKSMEILSAFLNQRGPAGEKVLLKMLNCLQGEFYITLTERRVKDKKFIYGWISNRII